MHLFLLIFEVFYAERHSKGRGAYLVRDSQSLFYLLTFLLCSSNWPWTGFAGRHLSSSVDSHCGLFHTISILYFHVSLAIFINYGPVASLTFQLCPPSSWRPLALSWTSTCLNYRPYLSIATLWTIAPLCWSPPVVWPRRRDQPTACSSCWYCSYIDYAYLLGSFGLVRGLPRPSYFYRKTFSLYILSFSSFARHYIHRFYSSSRSTPRLYCRSCRWSSSCGFGLCIREDLLAASSCRF